jgi:GTPase involved in cell partitioning and DNA repair
MQVDNLLHLHERSVWTAAAGANGDPTQGSQAPKRLKRTSSHAKPLHVPVPMGTIVKSKKGTLLAELLRVGASYCVCQGGMPGRGVVMPKKVQPRAQGPSKAERRLQVCSLGF